MPYPTTSILTLEKLVHVCNRRELGMSYREIATEWDGTGLHPADISIWRSQNASVVVEIDGEDLELFFGDLLDAAEEVWEDGLPDEVLDILEDHVRKDIHPNHGRNLLAAYQWKHEIRRGRKRRLEADLSGNLVVRTTMPENELLKGSG